MIIPSDTQAVILAAQMADRLEQDGVVRPRHIEMSDGSFINVGMLSITLYRNEQCEVAMERRTAASLDANDYLQNPPRES